MLQKVFFITTGYNFALFQGSCFSRIWRSLTCQDANVFHTYHILNPIVEVSKVYHEISLHEMKPLLRNSGSQKLNTYIYIYFRGLITKTELLRNRIIKKQKY